MRPRIQTKQGDRLLCSQPNVCFWIFAEFKPDICGWWQQQQEAPGAGLDPDMRVRESHLGSLPQGARSEQIFGYCYGAGYIHTTEESSADFTL